MKRRQFLKTLALGTAWGAPMVVSPKILRAAEKPSETVRLAYIGLGGRGKTLTGFTLNNASTAALCDPDQERLNDARSKFPEARARRDMREVFDDRDIDAVVIATGNYWHCLAAIWAMEAGKDVYVEKPLCMNFREGRAVVDTARRLGRICQIGTQMRCDPVFHPEVQKFLHEDKALGEIRTVRVNRVFARKPIGLRNTPLPIPETVDYNLWLGPAPEEPLYRDALHYDWHWMWRTGHGEVGNWGAHLLDDCRNDIFQDRIRMPKRVLCAGGRVGYNDAGQTPNSIMIHFDTGSIPVVFCISNLPDKDNPRSAGEVAGPTSGYVAYCEGGRYEKRWGRAAAFDSDGKKIREFVGTDEYKGGGTHQQAFVEAIRQGDKNLLPAGIEIGFDSSAWYNSANTAYRLGGAFSKTDILAADKKTDGQLAAALADLEKHLGRQGYKVSDDTFRLSPFLEVDEKNECFAGPAAAQANRLMEISYRKGFEFPA
ncbi:MAG: Gfo/Idh/MocA family oxidoreductase [Thermoguttaceae bacterium]|nr:Gfo/Idh/MocA family oxidoreductase [Thermoguttaceae bacterium]